MIELLSTDDEVLQVNPKSTSVIKGVNEDFCRILVGNHWFQIKMSAKKLMEMKEIHG